MSSLDFSLSTKNESRWYLLCKIEGVVIYVCRAIDYLLISQHSIEKQKKRKKKLQFYLLKWKYFQIENFVFNYFCILIYISQTFEIFSYQIYFNKVGNFIWRKNTK